MSFDNWFDLDKVVVGVNCSNGVTSFKYAMLQTNGVDVRLRNI